jgi:hypothetical protein
MNAKLTLHDVGVSVPWSKGVAATMVTQESGGCESRDPHLRTTAVVRAVTASPAGGTRARPPSFVSTPGWAV